MFQVTFKLIKLFSEILVIMKILPVLSPGKYQSRKIEMKISRKKQTDTSTVINVREKALAFLVGGEMEK